MLHQMKLYASPFEKIKSGTKTIEMRLNDEKRSILKIGDEIEFTNIENNETIKCIILNLYKYKDFYELFSHHDKESIGYSKEEVANPCDMLSYYTIDDIKKYGSLAIEIKLL